MSVLGEYPVMASGSKVLQPDALEDFIGSPEQGATMEIVTGAESLSGPDGEVVPKYIDIVVEHTNGVDFYAVPIVDGEELSELLTFFSRPPVGTGKVERHSFRMHLYKSHGSYTTGVRGTAVQVKFYVTDPRGEFFFTILNVAVHGLHAVRSTEVGE